MSNPFSQRVNRQLMLAQQQLAVEVDTSSASGRLKQLGVFEAAVFHLYRAYLEMLRELAENYQVESPESVASLADLQQGLEKLDKTPAEARELAELQNHGFIADLMGAWNSFFQVASSAPVKINAPRPAGLISAREVKDSELDRETLSIWISKLREVSDRHRDVMVEY